MRNVKVSDVNTGARSVTIIGVGENAIVNVGGWMPEGSKKEPLPIDDVIMSEAECARMIGLAPETLNGLRRRGQAPPFFQVSGHVVRYSKARILEWLQAREVEGATIKQIEESGPKS